MLKLHNFLIFNFQVHKGTHFCQDGTLGSKLKQQGKKTQVKKSKGKKENKILPEMSFHFCFVKCVLLLCLQGYYYFCLKTMRKTFLQQFFHCFKNSKYKTEQHKNTKLYFWQTKHKNCCRSVCIMPAYNLYVKMYDLNKYT